jgi:CRISPR-associated protein Cas1
MKIDYYIFNSGTLSRNNFNVLFIDSDNKKKIIPIKTIENIFIFGKINLNSDLILYFGSCNINVHFFNHYSTYKSSITGVGLQHSGNTHLAQAKHCLDYDKRMYIARQFVISGIWGMNKNLKSYNKGESILNIKKIYDKINNSSNIQELMGYEGYFRKLYYKRLGFIFKNFVFNKRIKRPPTDEINAMISFGNSLCYNFCLNAIKQTFLNSTISFLHESGERRHSLCLDISEIFKPIIIDRVILNLVNNNIIKKNMFIKDTDFCYISEKGKKIFIEAIENKLTSTFYYRKLNKTISYKSLIISECHKLCKHILCGEKYKSLKIDW